MIITNCTRQIERIAFHQCQNADVNSGWLLDYAYTAMGTIAERLEFRDYSKSSPRPLFYTGGCAPPTLVQGLTESVTVNEYSFPTLKAETAITACDVDEMRITPEGDLTAVQLRWQETVNRKISDALLAPREALLRSEAITLAKYGGYTLHSSLTDNVGVLDFNRNASLANIDLTGTPEAWTEQCANPFTTLEDILQDMARCGGVSGPVALIHGTSAWKALSAHEERDAIKYSQRPGASFDRSMSSALAPFANYNDVQFKGTTNGGQFEHWVSNAFYYDHTGTLVPMVAPGEVLILSRAAFGGKMVYRRISNDGKEMLPAGLPFWLYDDPELEYDRKCESYKPWLKDQHLFVPTNVNGAALIRVTPDVVNICVPCEDC